MKHAIELPASLTPKSRIMGTGPVDDPGTSCFFPLGWHESGSPLMRSTAVHMKASGIVRSSKDGSTAGRFHRATSAFDNVKVGGTGTEGGALGLLVDEEDDSRH